MIETIEPNNWKNGDFGSTAAIRRRRELQPVGGNRGKVFPPTLSAPVYVREKRHVTDCNDSELFSDAFAYRPYTGVVTPLQPRGSAAKADEAALKRYWVAHN